MQVTRRAWYYKLDVSSVLSPLRTLTMSFQLPELPVNIAYGVVGIVTTITVIAKLSQGSNVSSVYIRNICSLYELL